MSKVRRRNSGGSLLVLSRETGTWYELTEMLSVLNADHGRRSWWYRVDVWSTLDVEREGRLEFTQNHEITPTELRAKMVDWEAQRQRAENT